MNVLSLFDGMSCGRIALERAGIPVTNYFASEIDKHAITVSKANWPDIIHLGDVTEIKSFDLDLMPEINLLIGGSPCQGFSFAGKGLNFEDPRSKLFFEYVRLKNLINPKYFFLENVIMKKESQDVISSYLGVEPILINSALVSAQNRRRLYWTNIKGINQPKDLGLTLKDIVEDGIEYEGGAIRGRYLSNGKTQQVLEINGTKKANSLTTVCKDSLCVQAGLKVAADEVRYRKLTPIEYERLQNVPDNYTACVCKTQRYRMLGNGWNVSTITHIFKNLKVTD